MNMTAETNNSKFSCEFCSRSFLRESTIAKHICEYKHRWQDKDKRGNQIGFQAWIQFYKRNTANTKKRTYLDFIKSTYYNAFAKFGTYCVDSKVINVSRYVEWLLKNKISIDVWNKDTHYTNFLIEYLRQEDPLDAVARSVETLQELSIDEKLQYNDYLRYGNKNKICYNITTGRISPWMLYHSSSGLKFIDTLDESQVKLILEYIDPEKWAIKFKRNPDIVKTVKEICDAGRY